MEMVIAVNSNGSLPAASAQSSIETERNSSARTRRFKLFKLPKLIIILAFTAIFALLGVSNVSDAGNMHLQISFIKRPSSYVILIFLGLSFYFGVFSTIIRVDFPNLSWVCVAMASACIYLCFTVLFFILLPPALTWIPCMFVVITSGVLAYQYDLFHLLLNNIRVWSQKTDPVPCTDAGDEALESSTDVV